MANSSKSLTIIGCGKRKIWNLRPSSGRVFAEDAYISNYFNLCKLYAARFSDKWLILSGKYGLIPPTMPIKNYDIITTPSSEFERMVEKQLTILNAGRYRIVNLCGGHYSWLIEKIAFSMALVWHSPLRGLKIGERQSRLKRSLYTDMPLEVSEQ